MPDPVSRINGIAAPLPARNLDTDVIMPKRFLRTITRAGLADGVFADLRFTSDQREQPVFVLNRDPWRHARILIVGDNFGCGSSREHAVWGLAQWGIAALVGTSFAGIFYDNCRRNGLAAISVDATLREALLALAAEPATAAMDIDLATLRITAGGGSYPFTLPAEIRSDLLAGRDAIGATLTHAGAIHAFEATYWAPA